MTFQNTGAGPYGSPTNTNIVLTNGGNVNFNETAVTATFGGAITGSGVVNVNPPMGSTLVLDPGSATTVIT
ncbi:hypothetical protein ACO1MN_14420, partial [Staphylococcus aureus]